MRLFTIFLVWIWAIPLMAQTLPAARTTDWTLAGYRGTMPSATPTDATTFGLVGDGVTNNSATLQAAINSFGGQPFVLEFPSGNFLFNGGISLPSNAVLRGKGADSTLFTFNLGGTGECIYIGGNAVTTDTSYFLNNAVKDSMAVVVNNAAPFAVGDFVKIIHNDSSLCYSTWAYKLIGQIVQITNVVGNRIEFASPLRKDYDLSKMPYLIRLNVKQNVGIECLKIKRLDATSGQTSNLYFNYAANCWVQGVEGENCNFAHIRLDNASNIVVNSCYLHHALAYGGSGQGYGIQLGSTSGECLIQNNVFEHLRHSVLLQSGANGNVIAYNYSFDPNWTELFFPNNAAGDLVLHGNYPYLNLFEGNIVQNIVIDNSHGANGMYNTFLRNRADLYGIVFSDGTSPNQNFLGNEITNSGSYGLYLLQGSGHFEFGNNIRGAITPSGTNPLPDSSYHYPAHPLFLPTMDFAAIGIPNSIGTGTNPARQRQFYGQETYNSCNELTTPRIFLETTALTIPEDTGSILIPIRATNVNWNNLSVEAQFDVINSTATNNTDADVCTTTSGICTLTWGTMDNTTQFLTIPIVDDLDIEGNETMRIRLNLVSSNVQLTTDSVLIITIIDNDVMAVESMSNTAYTIYPNPTNDVLYVQTSQLAERIELWNSLGQSVQIIESPSQVISMLKTADLPKGTYFVRILAATKSWVQAVEVR